MDGRCPWAKHELEIAYHDAEWGVPVYSSDELFAKLVLDGFQAGLSWLTILKKRDGFYSAFDDFDAAKIARYSEKRTAKLMQDEGIIRNRQKIAATVSNAQAYLRMLDEEPDGFAGWLWGFTDGKPIVNKWKLDSDVPAESELSQTVSKELKRRGFKFCGPTIVYAFMQAVGMVNDHLVSCPRHKEVQQL